MKVTTRLFGEIEVAEDKTITFPDGILGFPDMKKFTLLHDSSREDVSLRYLQSLDDGDYCLPVVDPLYIKEEFNPAIKESDIEALQPLETDNMLILVTVTVPVDIKQMTANLSGLIIINSDTNKAVQVMVEEGDDYAVKYPIYEYLEKQKHK
ncbi:MAG: flagellar assembly protein FliW [Butyrivibrio sp.]|nr:flagellar assembly protein FliW [Butyrivibrio sp.]